MVASQFAQVVDETLRSAVPSLRELSTSKSVDLPTQGVDLATREDIKMETVVAGIESLLLEGRGCDPVEAEVAADLYDGEDSSIRWRQ